MIVQKIPAKSLKNNSIGVKLTNPSSPHIFLILYIAGSVHGIIPFTHGVTLKHIALYRC